MEPKNQLTAERVSDAFDIFCGITEQNTEGLGSILNFTIFVGAEILTPKAIIHSERALRKIEMIEGPHHFTILMAHKARQNSWLRKMLIPPFKAYLMLRFINLTVYMMIKDLNPWLK